MIQWLARILDDGLDGWDLGVLLAAIFGAAEASAAQAKPPAAYCVVRAWDEQGQVLVEYEKNPEKAERRRQDLNDQHPDWTVIVELAVV